ncbi:tetratricopeptide repeat-containing sensor histidine kinase [Fibrella aquatilis]|uniref:histidine kinase n=1 Tax=Fibrella aquatilis TaxID=2817059 RepID=A0A939G1L8_9BACT|nr:tetratricopeptide repeat protein [Fibrella aquatilis]MBO0929420.1 tetratricopeptide repeat protein [Fibrella aquatilis]
MRYSFILVITTLLLNATVATAQSASPIDSLEVYLRTHSPTDSVYVRAMDKVIIEYVFKKADYSRADSLSRQMADVASRIGFWTGLVGAYRNRAIIAQLKADNKQLLLFSQKTLEVAEQHALPPKTIYGSLCNLAVAYDKSGQPEQVLQTALRAIRYQEQHHITPRFPIPHRLIGGALATMGRLQQAIPYYKEAGVIFRELGDKRGIAIFEYQLGDFYRDLKQPAEALRHHRQALALGEALQYELLQFDGLNGIANDLVALNRPAEGFAPARRALAIVQKQKNKLGICTAYTTLGDLYRGQKQYEQAASYFKQAIELANTNGYKDELKKASQHLADLYGEQKDFQQAYVYQLQKNNLVDSAAQVNTNAEVQRLIARYQADKKEAQIRLLQQEKRIQQEEAARSRWQRNALVLGAGLLLLLGVAIGAWLLNRAKVQRLEEALTLRKQIAHDLHDEVGSTLSSISLLSGHTNMLLSQNKPETAQRMVQKIYTDARQILESIDEIIWTINPGNDSLHRVAMRLQEYAQPLMESKNIRFSSDISPRLADVPVPMDIRRNLYLIGKEAINNLIKYSEATEATIRFDHVDGKLAVQIDDNGQGFDPSKPSVRTGQASMQQRAQAMGGTLNVQSAPGKGTQLRLEVSPA